MPDDYEVGYGRPPKHTRFKKGQSGNPKGRPKGAKNVATDLLEEMQEHIIVREGGKKKGVTKQRAMVKSLMAKAVQAELKAVAMGFDLVERLDKAQSANGGLGPHWMQEQSARETVDRRLERLRQEHAQEASCESPVDPGQET